MSLLMPCIIGPTPHLSTVPPPFGNLAALNAICAMVLALCLVGLRTLGSRLTSRLPLAALIATLGAAGLTFSVNVFYASNAKATLSPWPPHLRPLGSFSYSASYSTPFNRLYGCTVVIICATAIQLVSTIVLLVRHRGTKTPPLHKKVLCFSQYFPKSPQFSAIMQK